MSIISQLNMRSDRPDCLLWIGCGDAKEIVAIASVLCSENCDFCIRAYEIEPGCCEIAELRIRRAELAGHIRAGCVSVVQLDVTQFDAAEMCAMTHFTNVYTTATAGPVLNSIILQIAQHTEAKHGDAPVVCGLLGYHWSQAKYGSIKIPDIHSRVRITLTGGSRVMLVSAIPTSFLVIGADEEEKE